MGCRQERVSEREKETLNLSLKDRRIWLGGEAPTWVKGLETQALLALSTTSHILSPLPVVLFRS